MCVLSRFHEQPFEVGTESLSNSSQGTQLARHGAARSNPGPGDSPKQDAYPRSFHGLLQFTGFSMRKSGQGAGANSSSKPQTLGEQGPPGEMPQTTVMSCPLTPSCRPITHPLWGASCLPKKLVPVPSVTSWKAPGALAWMGPRWDGWDQVRRGHSGAPSVRLPVPPGPHHTRHCEGGEFLLLSPHFLACAVASPPSCGSSHRFPSLSLPSGGHLRTSPASGQCLEAKAEVDMEEEEGGAGTGRAFQNRLH